VFVLRLECLCLEVVDAGAHERRYGHLGLGANRGRKVGRTELVPRIQSRDSESELGIDMFLVQVLYFGFENHDMQSKHYHSELLAEKPRCVCERSAIDRPTRKARAYAEYDLDL